MSKTLIIDPGHGGIDNGTNGFGVVEKDWNLKMSLYQHKRLKELGAAVFLTRTGEKNLDSVQRTNLIKNKYDYCMSNHFNGFNGEARGVETIHSIFSSNTLATRLAKAVTDASRLPLRRVFDRENNAGTDYYYMHRMTGTTQTIIVEYGFMDNKSDHAFYKNEENFYRVAESVIKEWCAILKIVYKKTGAAIEKVPEPSLNKKVNYLVQVGAYNSVESAEKMQERLETLGVDSIIKPFDEQEPIAPSKPVKPAEKPVETLVGARLVKKEDGYFLATDNIKVRTAPDVKAKYTGTLEKGNSIRYYSVYEGNGYRWLQYVGNSGNKLYLPYRAIDDVHDQWGTFHSKRP